MIQLQSLIFSTYQSEHYDINYEVRNGYINFVDRASNIIIKIKNQGINFG